MITAPLDFSRLSRRCWKLIVRKKSTPNSKSWNRKKQNWKNAGVIKTEPLSLAQRTFSRGRGLWLLRAFPSLGCRECFEEVASRIGAAFFISRFEKETSKPGRQLSLFRAELSAQYLANMIQHVSLDATEI